MVCLNDWLGGRTIERYAEFSFGHQRNYREHLAVQKHKRREASSKRAPLRYKPAKIVAPPLVKHDMVISDNNWRCSTGSGADIHVRTTVIKRLLPIFRSLDIWKLLPCFFGWNGRIFSFFFFHLNTKFFFIIRKKERHSSFWGKKEKKTNEMEKKRTTRQYKFNLILFESLIYNSTNESYDVSR